MNVKLSDKRWTFLNKDVTYNDISCAEIYYDIIDLVTWKGVHKRLGV